MQSAEQGSRAFQAPVDVHASADGQVYLFKRRQSEPAPTSDDEDHVVVEQRPQVYQSQERNVQFLEREVLDGDTLNKFALQHGCKVADMKRANNIIQEQDFYALKSVRIPIQKHSFLEEITVNPSDHQEDLLHSSDKLKPLDNSGAQQQPGEVSDFVMDVDEDTQRLMQSLNDPEEEKPRLVIKQGPMTKPDWGFRWWNAVVAMLLVGILLPIFVVLIINLKDNTDVPSSADPMVSPSNSFSNASRLSTAADDERE